MSRGTALPFHDLGTEYGGGRLALRPGRFTPGKTRYPLYRRLGGPQGRSGRVRKISPPPGFNPRPVQTLASRYTDWAIPTPLFGDKEVKFSEWSTSWKFILEWITVNVVLSDAVIVMYVVLKMIEKHVP